MGRVTNRYVITNRYIPRTVALSRNVNYEPFHLPNHEPVRSNEPLHERVATYTMPYHTTSYHTVYVPYHTIPFRPVHRVHREEMDEDDPRTQLITAEPEFLVFEVRDSDSATTDRGERQRVCV